MSDNSDIVPNSSASNTNNEACAACIYRRKECPPDCILRTYFSADDEQTLLRFYNVFGIDKIEEHLSSIPDRRRVFAMMGLNSMLLGYIQYSSRQPGALMEVGSSSGHILNVDDTQRECNVTLLSHSSEPVSTDLSLNAGPTEQASLAAHGFGFHGPVVPSAHTERESSSGYTDVNDDQRPPKKRRERSSSNQDPNYDGQGSTSVASLEGSGFGMDDDSALKKQIIPFLGNSEDNTANSREQTRVMIGVNQSSIKGYPHASLSSQAAFQWTLENIIRDDISGFKLLILHIHRGPQDNNEMDPYSTTYRSLDDFQRMENKNRGGVIGLLECYVRKCNEIGIECEAWTRKGDHPQETICQEVQRVIPDVLVVGTDGNFGWLLM